MVKAGIIGLGLIGGSLGLALRKYVRDVKIWGYDVNEKHQQYAEENKLVDDFLDKNRINRLDILFLAVPVRSVIDVLGNIQSCLNRNKTIITDAGSTKSYLFRTISCEFPRIKYIGGHPMTGKETSGPAAAEADLFADKNYVLLEPQNKELTEEYNYLKSIISRFKCNIIQLTPEIHDRLTAVSSHLPQFLATCLMNEYIEVEKNSSCLPRLTGSGFKDMSRIAASEPSMWLDIFLSNRENILRTITGLENQINKLKTAIADEDEKTIKKLMSSGRKRRIQMKEGE